MVHVHNTGVKHDSLLVYYGLHLLPLARVFERLDSENIWDVLRDRFSLVSSILRAQWARQVADGMRYLSERGIVHGRLSDRCVFLRPGSGMANLKIGGYGAALQNLVDGSLQLRDSLEMVEMAPELLHDDATVPLLCIKKNISVVRTVGCVLMRKCSARTSPPTKAELRRNRV